MELSTEKPTWYSRLSSLAGFTASGLGGGLLAVLAGTAFFATTHMDTKNFCMERISYSWDSVLLNFLYLLTCVAVFWVLMFLLGKLPDWSMFLIAGIFVLAFALIWVIGAQSAPNNDSGIVTQTGAKLASGDLSGLQRSYYVYFPFQLGYVLWTQVWSSILHVGDNYVPLEVVNAVCVAAGAVGLIRLTGLLFPDRMPMRAAVLFVLAFPQGAIFSTFLYGNIPSFAFATWALCAFVSHTRKPAWWKMVLCGLALCMAVCLKLNSLIVMVAVAIAYLLWIVRNKKWLQTLALIGLVLAVVFGKGLPQLYYEKTTGIRFGKGIPMVSWAAMGTAEGAYIAPGWYISELTRGTFEDSDRDPELTAKRSGEILKKRLGELASKPGEAFRFFYEKGASQWNETTYQSVWNTEVRGCYNEDGRTGLARFITDGHQEGFAQVLDATAMFMYACAAGGAILLIVKKKEPETAVLPILFLGGFFYHEIFEAKSQYVMTYALWLLPLAAFGFSEFVGCLEKLFRTGNRQTKEKAKIAEDTGIRSGPEEGKEETCEDGSDVSA